MGNVINLAVAMSKRAESQPAPALPAASEGTAPQLTLDMSSALILEHDSEFPQWQRPLVWSGESERQIRALCSQFQFERIPLALEELVVFLPYVRWMLQRKYALDNYYPADCREGMAEAAVQTIAMYFPQWAPGLEAYQAGDLARLKDLHRGDAIYKQLLEGGGAEVKAEMDKILAAAADPQSAPAL